MTSKKSTNKNQNPHKYITNKFDCAIKSLETIRRIDKDGFLYYMENYINYSSNKGFNKLVEDYEQKTSKWTTSTFVDACSAFCAQDFDGTMLTGRAYDYRHLSKGINTGMNIMIHTKKDPENGILYETIATTDATLSQNSLAKGDKLMAGSLDDGKSDVSFVALLPYLVTDGINEKGFTASILLLPLDSEIKNHKEPLTAYKLVKSKCKRQVSIPRTTRLMLDTCETVQEAEKLLKTIWALRFSGNNAHIFVTDRFGNSRLFEWYSTSEDAKTQMFTSIKTNAATNFYQSFSYIPKGMPQLINLKNKYNYGWSRDGEYRNTYDRFNTIVSMLDFYTVDPAPLGEIHQAIMKEQTADAILRTIALYPCPSSPNHQTQFSHLFNSKELTQKTYSFANLDKCYVYSLKKHKFI